jgi:hypothetical protein
MPESNPPAPTMSGNTHGRTRWEPEPIVAPSPAGAGGVYPPARPRNSAVAQCNAAVKAIAPRPATIPITTLRMSHLRRYPARRMRVASVANRLPIAVIMR